MSTEQQQNQSQLVSPQENETTMEGKCICKKIGKIYVIVGPGDLCEKPYVRCVGSTTRGHIFMSDLKTGSAWMRNVNKKDICVCVIAEMWAFEYIPSDNLVIDSRWKCINKSLFDNYNGYGEYCLDSDNQVRRREQDEQ